jgi:polysaccharide chain length determinant protein (PEP-CTERM system associated)
MRDDLKRAVEEDAEPQKGVAVERLRSAWGRRKWLAVLVFAFPFAAAASVIFSLPTFYRSTAVVLVERQQVPEALVPATVTSELETRLQTINQEILSRSRLESLITRFGLYPGPRKQDPTEEIVERMRKDIKLELKTTDTKGRPSATTAFALSYRGPDPRTVALVTNTLASLYIEENLKLRERQSAGTADFLKVQLGETRKRLDELEARVSEYRRRYMGELPQQMPANLATLEGLHAQLRLNSDNQLRASERRENLKAQLAEAASMPQLFGALPGSEPGTQPIYETRAQRLGRLKLDLVTALANYTEAHPTVMRLRREIQALERATDEAATKDAGSALPATPYTLRLKEALQSTEGESKILKAEEQRLRTGIAAYQARVENTPRREQEFQEVSRDYETTKQLYESLGKRQEAAQLAESMEQRQKGEQFRILEPAMPSQIPAAPNRLRLLVVSLVLSLGLAGGVLMVAEMLDTSFHSADELREFSIVPVLVSVPRIVTDADRQRQHERFRLAAAGAMVALVLIAGVSYFIGHGNEQLVQMLAGGGS